MALHPFLMDFPPVFLCYDKLALTDLGPGKTSDFRVWVGGWATRGGVRGSAASGETERPHQGCRGSTRRGGSGAGHGDLL